MSELAMVNFSSDDFKQQMTDYVNAMSKVNLYVYSITQQSMPVLSYPPTNYGDFTTKFAPAKAHCMDWTNSIFPTMLSFPKSIVDQFDDFFNIQETMADVYLQRLQKDPNDEKSKKGLNASLKTMQNIIQQQIKIAEGLITSLNSFSVNITADADILNFIATSALDDVKSDKQKIIDLNNSIKNLQDEISTLQTWLTVSQIGSVLSIFVGLVGAVCCVIPGAQGVGIGLIVVGVLGEAGSITGWVLSQKAIDAANDQIDSQRNQIDGYNQDVILLQGINTSFKYLIDANMEAQKAIKVVIEVWQQLDNEIEIVRKDLADVDSDVTSASYVKASDDLNKANEAWQDVVEFAKALAGIDYKWQDKEGNWHNYTDEAPTMDGANIDVAKSSVA